MEDRGHHMENADGIPSTNATLLNRCLIKNCQKNGSENPRFSYVCLPYRDEDRLEKWLSNIGRRDLLEEGEALKLYRLCTDHFNPDQFIKAGEKSSLKWNAIPTYFNNVPEKLQEDPEIKIDKFSEGDPTISLCVVCGNIPLKSDIKYYMDFYDADKKTIGKRLETVLKQEIPMNIISSGFNLLCNTCFGDLVSIEQYDQFTRNFKNKFMDNIKSLESYTDSKERNLQDQSSGEGLGQNHTKFSNLLHITQRKNCEDNTLLYFYDEITNRENIINESYITHGFCLVSSESKDSFSIHSKVSHSKNRVYQCKRCSGVFLEPDHLKQHLVKCPNHADYTKIRSFEKIKAPRRSQRQKQSKPKVETCRVYETRQSRREKRGQTKQTIPLIKTQDKCDYQKETKCINLSEENHPSAMNELPEYDEEIEIEQQSSDEGGIFDEGQKAKRPLDKDDGHKAKCEKCKKFVQRRWLNRHMASRHAIYQCDICGTEIEGRVHIKFHRRRCTKDVENERKVKIQIAPLKKKKSKCSEYLCDFCGHIAKEWLKYRDHRKQHLNAVRRGKSKYTECPTCKKQIKEYRLKVHMKLHVGPKTFMCLHCGKCFKQKSTLKIHEEIHSEETPYECEKCNMKFRRRAFYLKHIKTNCNFVPPPRRQGQRAVSSSSKSKHLCNACDKEFKFEYQLQIHEIMHGYDDTKGPFICPFCMNNYILKSKLKTHITDHLLSDKGNVCNKCGHAFHSKSHLKMHMNRAHSIIESSQCTVCNKKFSSRGYLNQHMFIHTGERPYKCTLCPSAFRQGPHLRNHMRIHTKIKPHACPICSNAFANAANLREHLKRLHKDSTIEYK